MIIELFFQSKILQHKLITSSLWPLDDDFVENFFLFHQRVFFLCKTKLLPFFCSYSTHTLWPFGAFLFVKTLHIFLDSKKRHCVTICSKIFVSDYKISLIVELSVFN